MSTKSKVIVALEKIGTSNGTKPPVAQDPLNAVIHEYHVSTIGESYFTARRKKAKAALERGINEVRRKTLIDAVKEVKSTEIGEKVTVAETEDYEALVNIKNGSSYLDVGTLKLELLKQYKLTTTQVEALIEKATLRREPSLSWEVMEDSNG